MGITSSSPFKEAKRAVNKAEKARRKYRKNPQHLTAAIIHHRLAYETSNGVNNQFADILINFAALLSKQDQLSGGKSNLEEVIRLLEEGRVLMEMRTPQTEHYGVLLNNLGQAYLKRYRISKTSQDHKSATRTFERARSQDVSSPGSSTYTTSLIGSATALWTACELQPQDDNSDFSRLNAAIAFLETALKQNERNIDMQAECYRHLASVYDLHYKKTTTRDNLDKSIRHYRKALDLLHLQSPNRAHTLANLAKQYFERHTLTKGDSDWKAAETYRDEAKTLVDQVPEAEELKKMIEVLTGNMDLYEKRGHTYTSESSDGRPSPRGTTSLDTITGQAHATDPAEYDVNRRDTFSSISAVASGSRQVTSSSLHEGSYSITGQAHKTEPAQFDSERRDTLASVAEEAGMHKNHTSETLPDASQPWQPAPSRKGVRNTGGEKMVQSPGSVLGQPLVTEPGQSARTTPGHHVAREKTGTHG